MVCLAGCGSAGSSPADAKTKKETSQEVSLAENNADDITEQAASQKSDVDGSRILIA